MEGILGPSGNTDETSYLMSSSLRNIEGSDPIFFKTSWNERILKKSHSGLWNYTLPVLLRISLRVFSSDFDSL